MEMIRKTCHCVVLLLTLVLSTSCTSYDKRRVSVDVKRLKTTVADLCAIAPPRCFSNPHSLNVAASRIRKRFETMGYSVREQTNFPSA